MPAFNYSDYLGFRDPEKDQSVLIGRNNVLLTAALFVERADQWADIKAQRKAEGKWDHEPIYTLGEHEVEGVLSAYQIYMNSVDEFDAALKLVGSVFHWQELCKKDWFLEQVNQWREHMALRDFSLAKMTTLQEAATGDGAAARHLLNFSHKVINPPPLKPKAKKAAAKKSKEEEIDTELDAISERFLK